MKTVSKIDYQTNQTLANMYGVVHVHNSIGVSKIRTKKKSVPLKKKSCQNNGWIRRLKPEVVSPVASEVRFTEEFSQ